jgi:type III pantothenate kinase
VVPLAFPDADPLGRSTQAAVQHGVMAGFADAVRGMLARLARHLGTPPTVVLTGGWAAWLRDHVPAAAPEAADAPAAFAAAAVHVAPHLVLHGARALTALNTEA